MIMEEALSRALEVTVLNKNLRIKGDRKLPSRVRAPQNHLGNALRHTV